MWRHLVAIAAAIGITLLVLQFWGNFGGAMTNFVKVKSAHDTAKLPMPVSVLSAGPVRCGKDAPCPTLPDTQVSPQSGAKTAPKANPAPAKKP